MRAVLLCFALLFAQCSKKVNNSAGTDAEAMKQTINTALGANTEQTYNASKTYLLAYRIKEATENFTSYVVVEVSSGTIIKQGTFVPGHIKWIDDTSLEMLSLPGTLPEGKSVSDYKTIITLKKNQ